jgi:hypothetical protein
MSREAKAESLSGTVQQLLFSPKGEIEGLLIKVGAKSVQISMHHATVNARALADAVGESIDVLVSPDHSPKTKKGVHPVHKLDVITKMPGEAERRMTVLGTPLTEAREVNRVAIE